jgi:hypothetical protein
MMGLKWIIETALEGYINIVQKKYPELKYCKVGAIKSLPGAKSQYEGHCRKFHSDYPQSVEELEPNLRPVSIIVGLNPFNFMWLPHRKSRESEIREMTVNPGEMIMFTNNCLHAGGANDTNEEQTRLFAYLVSDASHFPLGTVTTWDWQQHCADPSIAKPSNSYNTLINKATDMYRLRLRTGRVATVPTLKTRETDDVSAILKYIMPYYSLTILILLIFRTIHVYPAMTLIKLNPTTSKTSQNTSPRNVIIISVRTAS